MWSLIFVYGDCMWLDGHNLKRSNRATYQFVEVSVTKYDATQSLVAVSSRLATNNRPCGLNAKVLGTRRS